MAETIDAILKGVTWEAAPDQPQDRHDSTGMPYATHQGEGEMLGVRFRCYRLSDGRSVIHADDMHAIIDKFIGGGD